MLRFATVLLPALGFISRASASACSPPPELQSALANHPAAAAYTDLGNWYGGHHQYECAVGAFESAHKLSPDSAEIDYLLGLSYHLAGHDQEAVDPLHRSVQTDPGVLKAHLLYAGVLARLGRPSAAAEQWEAALHIDPHSSEAQDGLCKAFLAQGQAEPVVAVLQNAHLDEALAVDLAQAYSMELRLDQAKQVILQAIRSYPASSGLAFALVTIDVKEGNPQDGARVAEAFAKQYPHNFAAQKLYLRTMEFNPDPAVALPLATKLLATAPHDPELLYLTGIGECESGHYESARKHLDEAVALDPAEYRDRFNVEYYLGSALLELNDFQGAKEQLEKAVQTNGANSDQLRSTARWKLVRVLRTLGDTQEAHEQARIYEQEKQAIEDRTQAAQKTVTADEEMERGDAQKAVNRYTDALKATPNDAQLNYKLAIALDAANDYTNERAALERAIAIDPTFALAHYQLGYVDSQQGDLPGAEQEFRLAVHAAPGYTKAWISLAATLGTESKFQEARQAAAHAVALAPHNPEALELRKELAQARMHP